MMSRSVTRILLITLVFFSFFYGINAPLFDEDEGFYAEAAREMLLKKEFVTITVNGEHRYDKPPLVFWLIAGSQHLFGPEEWAVRLPSVMMTLALLWFLVRFTPVKDQRSTIVILFAGSIQLSMIGKAAIADATLNFLMTVTLLNLWKFLENSRSGFLTIAYAAAGLAFLAKGPVAMVIPAGVVLIWVIRYKKWERALKLFHLPSILLFACIVVPWFYLSYRKVGSLVIEDFFFKHNLGRFTHAMESHGGGWFYYIPVFLTGLLPFSFIFLRSLTSFQKNIGDPFRFFLLTWFGLVFLLFSFSGTKLPHYILIGYVPLILLASGSVSESGRKSAFYSGFFLLTVFIAAPLSAPHFSPLIKDSYVQAVISGVSEVFGPFYFSLMSAGVIVLFFFFRKTHNGLLPAALVAILAFNTFFRYYARLQQAPVKEIALASSGIREKIITPDHYFPSFSFYSKKTCLIRVPEPGDLVFGKMEGFRDYKKQVISEKYGVGLVRIEEK